MKKRLPHRSWTLIATIFLFFAVVGKAELVAPGMARIHVLQELGEPASTMSRGGIKVLAYRNGAKITLVDGLVTEAVGLPPSSDRELGCGVLSTTKKDWHWKLEGGMSLNTAALGKLKDQPVALIGGMDGFVAAVDLSDGQVTRRQHVGSPVIGITPLESGALVVATQTEIQFLNQNWEHLHTLSRQVKRVLTVSANRLLVCHEDMTLELLELRTD
ncbi:MAG: hypothetical protein CMI16_11310 [Opitutaceae bacterium]|nr:hypothetical protein [Opitutaceae bacterium]